MKAYETACLFLGEKEKPGNGGFYNEALQRVMTKAGHKKGEAWCCYFTEAMFCLAYPQLEPELRKLFSGSTVATFRNFRNSGKYVISKHPIPGSLVIWQKHNKGVPTGFGHAGIVAPEECGDTYFLSIEGNTNSSGSREGDSIQVKKRDILPRATGLNVLGFIQIAP